MSRFLRLRVFPILLIVAILTLGSTVAAQSGGVITTTLIPITFTYYPVTVTQTVTQFLSQILTVSVTVTQSGSSTVTSSSSSSSSTTGTTNTLTSNPISVVQTAHGSWSGGSTFSVTLGTVPINGDSLIMTYGENSYGTPASIVSISQTGATWISQMTNGKAEIWAAFNVLNAGTTITLTIVTSGPPYGAIAIIKEVAGLVGLDRTATATGNNGNSGAVFNAGTLNTSSANEYWIATIQNDAYGQSGPAINGWTSEAVYGSGALWTGFMDKIVSATGIASTGEPANGFCYGIIATFLGNPQSTITITGGIPQKLPQNILLGIQWNTFASQRLNQVDGFGYLDPATSVSAAQLGIATVITYGDCSNWATTTTALVNLVQNDPYVTAIILDEPQWNSFSGLGHCQTWLFTGDIFESIRTAVSNVNPNILVGVVEPYISMFQKTFATGNFAPDLLLLEDYPGWDTCEHSASYPPCGGMPGYNTLVTWKNNPSYGGRLKYIGMFYVPQTPQSDLRQIIANGDTIINLPCTDITCTQTWQWPCIFAYLTNVYDPSKPIPSGFPYSCPLS